MTTTFPLTFPATFQPTEVAPLPTAPDGSNLSPGEIAFAQTKLLEGLFPYALGQMGEPDPRKDPLAAFRYAKKRREVEELAAKQRPMMRIYDGSMNYVTHLTGEMAGSCEEIVADSGKATAAIRFNNAVGDFLLNETKIHEDLHLVIDPIPSQRTWRTRWGGKITGIVGRKDSNGIHTIELEAVHNREHAKHLLFGANPVFPPEVQLPKMWVLPGNTRTILALSMFVNLARLFFPALSIPTNIFNPGGWINPLGPDSIMNLDPLSWPLQMCFVNAAFDQSRTSALGATWTDWHSAMDPLLQDAGCVFRAHTWLTEDEETCHDELADAARLLGPIGTPLAEATRPKRNCVAFRITDESGRDGPTGTAFDGIINAAAVTFGDLLSPILVNVETGETYQGRDLVEASGEQRSTIVERLAGVAKKPPRVIWWEGQYSGTIESERRLHKGPVKTIMTGGRSPSIVNQAQTFAIRYALSQLGQTIAAGIGAYATPFAEGLDNLYQGQLDNVLFAWQRFTDPMRALFSGDMAWQEHFERGGGVAYVLSSVLTLRVGHYKTRAWQGFTTKVINGRPHLVDVDITLGERGGFEQDRIIFVDQLTAIKRHWDRDTPVTVDLSLGDDRDKEDPASRGVRMLQAMWAVLGMFLGEGTIFG